MWDLIRLFKGNWQEKRIPVFLPENLTPEEQDAIIEEWLDDATDALCPVKLPVFARSRWCSSAKTIIHIFLWTHCHALFSDVVSGFLLAVGWSLKKRKFAETLPGDSDDRNNADSLQVVTVTAQANADVSSTFWAAFNYNAKTRAEKIANEIDLCFYAFLWLIGLQPVMDLMQHCLWLASERFDDEQLFQASLGRPRTFRVLEAARGQVTLAYLIAMHILLTVDGVWKSLMDKYRTVRHRSQVWASLTRNLGCIWFGVTFAYMCYPYRLWLLIDPLLNVAETARKLFHDRRCSWCAFTHKFRACFPTEASLRGSKCLAVLRLLAALLRLDTSRIECRHASIRRQLRQKGATWLAAFEEVSASFILMRARILESLANPASSHTGAGSRHIGGMFRAFCSQWLKQHPLDQFDSKAVRFETMAHAYHEFLVSGSAEDKELFRRLGEALMLKGRASRMAAQQLHTSGKPSSTTMSASADAARCPAQSHSDQVVEDTRILPATSAVPFYDGSLEVYRESPTLFSNVPV